MCAWGTRSCHLDQRESGYRTESNSRNPLLFHIRIAGTYGCSYPKGMFFLWYEPWVVPLPEWHCLNYPGKRPQTACKKLKKNWNRRRRSAHRGKRGVKVYKKTAARPFFRVAAVVERPCAVSCRDSGRSCCAGTLCKAICTRCL